jgi:hypothetical protein
MSLQGVLVSGVPARLSHRGRQLDVISMLDTGTKGTHAFIDHTLAQELGLPRERKTEFVVVGGELKVGFYSTLDELSLPTVANCVIKNATVLVGDAGKDRTKVLVGEDFIRDVGGELKFFPDKTLISCKGGTETAIPYSKVPVQEILLVGAAVVLGITLLVVLT